MKKILIFSTGYFPFVGGAEVAVKEITDNIADFHFDMITVRLKKEDKKEEKIGNIYVYRIGFGLGRFDKFLFPFRASRLASRLHQKNKYDIAWSIMASFGGFAALFFKKKNPEVKFLLTLQEGDDLAEIEQKVYFVKKWFREIFTKADYIQCISNYLADWAERMSAECPIEVVPNGVSLDKFQDTRNNNPFNSADRQINFKTQNSNLKQKLNLDNADKILITTSRLVKKNAVDDVIKALKYLPDNIKFLVLGIGEDLEKLKELANEIKVAERVKFLGQVSHEDLPKYLAIADVFVRPSLSEGLGNSFLEAMAAGLPVIATPVGGIPDFLKDGETGWFCEVKDPKSIAEKIKYILDEKNKDEIERVKEDAEKLVKEKYNWNLVAQKMKNIFSRI